MDGISRSRGWDTEIPHGVLPMEQLVLSDKWARKLRHITLNVILREIVPVIEGICSLLIQCACSLYTTV